MKNTPETAKLLGITENDLKKKWRRGIITPEKVENRRLWWDPEKVRAQIEQHRAEKAQARKRYIEKRKADRHARHLATYQPRKGTEKAQPSENPTV